MAESVLIMGPPGSGKSTSLENLDPKTTFIINVASKALPFQGWKKNYTPFNSKEKTGNIVNSSECSVILKVMDIVNKEMLEINSLIIEDFQFMSAFEYMNRAEETGYQKFNVIAKNMYLVATKPKDMREDLIVFFINHEDHQGDDDGDYQIKAKTVGKLIDNMISLEGLFRVVLHSIAQKTKTGIEYLFETQTDSHTTAKSPKGMFKDLKIPNDLQLVRNGILNYDN